MNKRFGYKKADLTDSVLMSFYLEYESRQKLRDLAIKESKSMGEILRNLIKKFLKGK